VLQKVRRSLAELAQGAEVGGRWSSRREMIRMRVADQPSDRKAAQVNSGRTTRDERNAFCFRDRTARVSTLERANRKSTALGNGRQQCRNARGDVSRGAPSHSRDLRAEIEPSSTSWHSYAGCQPLVTVDAYVVIEALSICETSSFETLGDLEPLGCGQQAEIEGLTRCGGAGCPIAMQIGDDARHALARDSSCGRSVGKDRASSIMLPVEPASKRAMSTTSPGIQRLLAGDHGDVIPPFQNSPFRRAKIHPPPTA
jgi:hypothetical protein